MGKALPHSAHPIQVLIGALRSQQLRFQPGALDISLSDAVR